MFMFLVFDSSVARNVRYLSWHLIVARSWSCIFFVTDGRPLGSAEAEAGRVGLNVVLWLVSACPRNRLLFLHVGVTLTSFTSHRESWRMTHVGIISIL